MRKFRLVRGKHSGRDASGALKSYRAGHTIEVEDNVDLVALFPNKFEEMGRPGRTEDMPPPDTIPNIDRRRVFSSTEEPPKTPPLPEGEAKAQEKQRKEKKANQKIADKVASEDEEKELLGNEVDEDEFVDEDEEEEDEREAIESKLGEDVTDKFEGVAELDLAVLKNENNYFIVDPANPNKALNKKGDDPLTTKKAVQKFVKEYSKGKDK